MALHQGGTSMTGDMTSRVEDYVRLRRSLGYTSTTRERSLRAFGRYLDEQGLHGPLPLSISLAWATTTTSTDPHNPARRLAGVRGFLRYLATIDGETDVAPPGYLGSAGPRKPPHIYSAAEVNELVVGAGRLTPIDGLRPHTYATLFGLLACTGLRVTEALSLTCPQVDLAGGVLTVHGKRGRTRLVPLHSSALTPLRAYAEHRNRHYSRGADAAFFRTDASAQISYNTAHHAFSQVRRELGWTTNGRTRQPRIHDLRHTMVVRRIQTWHAEGVDVDARLPLLATYLGHAELRSLYWYLSATPELMRIIGVQFDAFATSPGAGV